MRNIQTKPTTKAELSTNNPSRANQPARLIDGGPTSCCRCGAPLCLRKQVINLALGSETQMLCLSCLASELHQNEAGVMDSIKSYILSRDCFRKEWQRYDLRACCPDPHGCVIDRCFGKEKH